MAKNNSEMKSLRKKLVAAIAMVMVASIMVVSSSYAWFTLSTAPEVKGIQTSVGSNGNLEIALRTGALNAIQTMTQGGGSFPNANNYWGNLIDLNYPQYGMSGIELAPGRLNVTAQTTNYTSKTTVTVADESGKAAYASGKMITVNGVEYPIVDTTWTDLRGEVTYQLSSSRYFLPTNNMGHLKIAQYGEDGRISSLDAASVETGIYDPTSQTFKRLDGTTDDYGVRAIGVVSGLSDAELALRNAKNAVNATISNVTTAGKNSIKNDASKLANIAIQQYTATNASFTDEDYENIVTALDNLDKIAANIKVALDQAVIAVGVQQGVVVTTVTWENGDIVTKNGEQAVTINWAVSTTVGNAYTALKNAYTAHATLGTNLGSARAELPTEKDGSYTFEEMKNVLNPLINVDGLTISVGNSEAKSVAEFKEVAFDHVSDVLGGASINVFMSQGIYCQIAQFVDNFAETAEITVDGGILVDSMAGDEFNIPVLLQTTGAMPADGAHLVYTSNWLGGLAAAGDSGAETGKSLSDIYGYIVDFAFRTNAANSNLLLQTSGTSRVDGNDAAAVQGQGSYMEFTIGSDGYTMAQMVTLMDAIRVVFIDEASEVMAIAKLDLEKTQVTEPDAAYDFIDANDQKWKMTYANVTGDTIKAPLSLYNFSLKADGSLQIGTKIAANNAVITALTQNVATGISAMVYLDGDKVENKDVAINGQSMTGTMNLQFASSADLVPMDYTFAEQQTEAPEAGE